MQEFELGGSSCCRVWSGELPVQEWRFDAVLEKRYSISCGESSSEAFEVAAEILIPRGARSLYGLLGARFSPIKGSDLLVTLPASEESSEQIFPGSLASKFDDVRVGLLSEYADFVTEGVATAIEDKVLVGTGCLALSCAAHGAASSNGPIFRALAYWLVQTWGRNEAVFNRQSLQDFLLI